MHYRPDPSPCRESKCRSGSKLSLESDHAVTLIRTLTQMHGSFSAIAENLVCCVIMAKQPEHTNLIKDIKKLVIERPSVILPRTSAILLSEFIPIMSTDPRCTQLS